MPAIDATCPFCRNAELEVNRADHVPEYRGMVWLTCDHCQAMFPVCRTLDAAVKLVESITVSCDRKAVVVDYLEEVK